MAKCSIFATVFEKNNPKHWDIDKLLELIRIGSYKEKINQIRVCEDKNKRRELKNFLPSICFSGTFEKRFDNKVIEHSGFTVLDLDHVENLQEKKKEVCSDEYTYACFVSPSGDGLKILVKIPPDKESHRDHYRGLMKKYPQTDSTSINISRVCFISYDPDIYINKDSKVWTTKIKHQAKEPEKIIGQDTNYKKVQVAVDMIRNSVDGEKHKVLIRASRLLGGYVASGLVEEHEAIRILETEINRKKPDDYEAAKKAIHAGIEHGKDSPIYPENEEKRIEFIKTEPIIIEGEPATDVIYLNTVRDQIVYSYKNGTSRGETTYFDRIDLAFRMARKELTVFHGYGGHGKSTFALQLALIKAIRDDHKWGVFSPENYPAQEFYKDLIHAYIGKSTEKWHKNQMSQQELEKGMDFVHEHFFFMYPEDQAPTPSYINMRFREMILKHNIDGCMIDPYNQLDTDISVTGGKEHLYLSKFLSMEKKFAVDNDVFLFIITHPRGDAELVGNNYKLPKVYSLSGGAMWNNKADNIICIHRPNIDNYEDKSVIFRSQKIKKQKLNGIPMEVIMEYDRHTARYYQENGYSPLDEINPVKEVQNVMPLNPPPMPKIDFYNTEKIDINEMPIPEYDPKAKDVF